MYVAMPIATTTATTTIDFESFPATDDLTGQFIGHLRKTMNLQAFSAGKPYPTDVPVPPAN
jgi:hypothetical protein